MVASRVAATKQALREAVIIVSGPFKRLDNDTSNGDC
jgi:hypothetical protein